MSEFYSALDALNALASASARLSERKEEINRLNVFPVPDGDTGTNMSLTLQSVVDNLATVPETATSAELRRAITTGALMGARGNSGVITSQILRGFCEGASDSSEITTELIDAAFARAVEVAFQAVRKPVEGTILTVLKDSAAAAKRARKKKLPLNEALEAIVSEAYDSVARTPDLLPVLKENGVVDAGGFGLAILLDAFSVALLGKSEALGDERALARAGAAPKVAIEQINDWEGSKYTYCNEFLVDSETLDKAEALDFLATMGDCELCVGDTPKFKVHVHSNHPDEVLHYFLERGQIFEVFIHNMKLQSEERNAKLAAEALQTTAPRGTSSAADASTDSAGVGAGAGSAVSALVGAGANTNGANGSEASGATSINGTVFANSTAFINGTTSANSSEHKHIGFVAVAAGSGQAAILKSLGVDAVVSGGQTMNPSTKDLLDAVSLLNADAAIILPNNSNIIMAATSACELASIPCAVVPTKSVPQAFSALFGADQTATLEENVSSMTEAFAEVRTGEITRAIKDSRDSFGNPISEGDVIGIADGAILAKGSSIEDVALELLGAMDASSADTCTLLAGQDYSDEQLSSLVERISSTSDFEDLELDAHRGDQPLYPLVFSVE